MAIGQGAVEATPLQLARIIGGIASGGHLVRPHVVFPDQLPADFCKSLLDSFPGSGDAYVPIDPENWEDHHGRHGPGDGAGDVPYCGLGAS